MKENENIKDIDVENLNDEELSELLAILEGIDEELKGMEEEYEKNDKQRKDRQNNE